MKALVSVTLLGLVALAAPARADDPTADTQSYRVRRGDTLELVAAEFYGDRNHAIFIMVENKLQHARALNPGERLKIPVSREITTSKGDTFESLAATYLGDAKRSAFLADFNARSPEDSLATGTTLAIPFHITHVAAAAETIGSIAAAYFGDTKQAEMLVRYNELGDKTQLDKGESIIVPIFHVRVRAQKLPPLDADSRSRRDQQQKAAVDAASALPVARTSWLQGDFAGVKTAFVRLTDQLDFLDTSQAVEIGMLLGKAYVAFDDAPAALAAFGIVLNRKPRQELSSYTDSPKVIAAWKKAGGHLEGD